MCPPHHSHTSTPDRTYPGRPPHTNRKRIKNTTKHLSQKKTKKSVNGSTGAHRTCVQNFRVLPIKKGVDFRILNKSLDILARARASLYIAINTTIYATALNKLGMKKRRLDFYAKRNNKIFYSEVYAGHTLPHVRQKNLSMVRNKKLM